jgi:uncharacterized integral membrane protein
MNIHEGAKRIKRTGQILSLIAILLALLLVIYPIVFQTVYPTSHPWFSSTPLLILTLIFLIPGGVIWIFGWILEGFTSKKS